MPKTWRSDICSFRKKNAKISDIAGYRAVNEIITVDFPFESAWINTTEPAATATPAKIANSIPFLSTPTLNLAIKKMTIATKRFPKMS